VIWEVLGLRSPNDRTIVRRGSCYVPKPSKFGAFGRTPADLEPGLLRETRAFSATLLRKPPIEQQATEPFMPMGLRERVVVSNVYNGLDQPTSQHAQHASRSVSLASLGAIGLALAVGAVDEARRCSRGVIAQRDAAVGSGVKRVVMPPITLALTAARSRMTIATPCCRSALRRRIVVERDRAIVQRVLAALVAACLAPICGCAIRYDHAGVTRVGIGLWGFGDPPGVNWNLDWPPQREVPDLPPMGPRDTPKLPRSLLEPIDDVPAASMHDIDAGRDVAIDDNRCRADYSNALAHFAPLSQRADPRGSPAPRR